MKIIQYPHPTLRRASKPLKRVDAALREVIRQMFDLMYDARGIGLAANQVDIPLQLFVCNPAGERGEGEEFAFLNPVVSKPKGNAEHEEGCLSLPGLYADVKRPASVELQAFTLDGHEIRWQLEGLMARVVQHEVDHLHGTLFIDRLSDAVQTEIRPALEEFELAYQNRQHCGEDASDEQIAANWQEWEGRYA